MLGLFVNLLYPALCHACGKKLEIWNHAICQDCLKKLKKRTPPFCIKCGRQLGSRIEISALCGDCRNSGPCYDRALSVFFYEGLLKELVHNFKYNKFASLSETFAQQVADFIKGYGAIENIDLVVSIPMHPSRLLKREINPAHLLAKHTARLLGIRYSKNVLRKIKNTPPQAKLKRGERIKNVKDSFLLNKNKSHAIVNKNILIVDDLFTTGSTVNECSRVLKEAGANRIEVITLARGDTIL